MGEVCVLYEDSRGPRKGFGLHALVTACVFDAANGERHKLEKALEGRLQKGAPALLKVCRDDLDSLARDGRAVIAVFDNDRIREQLQLRKNATEAQVETAIRKGTSSTRLSIVLLKQNVESVLKAAKECDPVIDDEQFEQAVRHKKLLDRDAILQNMSRQQARALRDCVLGKNASLQRLIHLICDELKHGPTSRTRPREKTRRPARR
jgi:hypothetical protein